MLVGVSNGLYPEIMTGPDFLRAIIEQGVSEDKERRTSTVKPTDAEKLMSKHHVYTVRKAR